MSDEPKTGEDALEAGYFGQVHDPLPNDAYTVTGQGEDTAQAERDAREQLRQKAREASVESSSPKAKAKSGGGGGGGASKASSSS
jgi:hypothetical protein